MLNYRWACLEDLDFLVELQIRDLKIFSNNEAKDQIMEKIKEFYYTGIVDNTCFTLLGFDNELFVTTGTLYLYSIMPSNENPLGIMGQLTNIWVEDKYRHQGIATNVVNELLLKAKTLCGTVCLNSSDETVALYQKLGFKVENNYMTKRCN